MFLKQNNYDFQNTNIWWEECQFYIFASLCGLTEDC